MHLTTHTHMHTRISIYTHLYFPSLLLLLHKAVSGTLFLSLLAGYMCFTITMFSPPQPHSSAKLLKCHMQTAEAQQKLIIRRHSQMDRMDKNHPSGTASQSVCHYSVIFLPP